MADFTLLITDWYRQNKRDLPWRNTNDPYKIWLSEIILQQTRVDQGLSYYFKFITNFPTVENLAAASEQEVLNLWQGLGYYSRARNLHFSAKYISNELNGKFPENYIDILKLKGVGSYTAAAIASFSYKETIAVVDGNVYRLLSRFFDIETPIDSTIGKKQFFELAQSLIDPQQPDIFNQAIMEFGALQCTPSNPNCMDCPLNIGCIAFSKQIIKSRPVKEKKTLVKDRFFHFLMFKEANKLIIEQRKSKDIWQNLFQFPLIETSSAIEIPAINSFTKNVPSLISSEIIHILSHQRLHTKFYHFTTLPEKIKPNWLIIDFENLDDFPLPRLIDRYLETI
jgi:A/G-specific adenine glycosylase